MRKLIILLFILIISVTIISSNSGSEFPKIKDVTHQIQYRKSAEYVDFNYFVKIQGVDRNYTMVLEVELYNEKQEQIKVFKDIINIKKDELQTFEGVKVMETNLAYEIKFVGAKLKLLEKKY